MRKLTTLLALISLLLINLGASAQDTIQQTREVYTTGNKPINVDINRADKSIDRAIKEIDGAIGEVNEAMNIVSEKTGINITLVNKEKRVERKTRHPLSGRRAHWSGIALTYNGLITNLGDLSLPASAGYLSQSPKSIGLSINLVDYSVPIAKKLGIVTGLGFEFNNFRFANDITLKRENGVTLPDYQYELRGINLKKSKLTTCYINVPLLIEWQFGAKNCFFLNGGVIGGWRYTAHTKIRATQPELKGKFKNHKNFGLKNFHYGYTVNIGYGSVGLTGTYYPGSIFRKGEGPQVSQANIGITLSM